MKRGDFAARTKSTRSRSVIFIKASPSLPQNSSVVDYLCEKQGYGALPWHIHRSVGVEERSGIVFSNGAVLGEVYDLANSDIHVLTV